VLISDYPDIDRASHNFRWGYSGTTVYDPTLTRVVYLNGFALYDIPGKTILAQLTNVYLGDEPKWSPDGSRIIVSAGAEFYLISRDGQITQASHMNPNYNPETRKGYDYMSSYYSWSPNGNKIALWLQVYDSKTINPTITLAVLDIASGIITDTCIPAGFNPEKLFKFPEPVWSPDGNSLVIDTNFNEEEKTTGVVLVDLEKQAAYKVLENYYPLGWLVAP
jgi:Tol biopolymer transport system component